MIRKIKFYLDNLESDIYTYDDSNYYWREAIDQDQVDWIYQNITTSWSEIPKNLQCNNCDFIGFEEDLIMYNETSTVDNTTLEYFKSCPNCKTDKYLQDI